MPFVDSGHSGWYSQPPKQTSNHLDEMKKSHKATLNKTLLENKAIEDQVVILNKSLKEAKVA